MKTSIKDIKGMIRNELKKMIKSTKNEDVDRLRRATDGAGETEFEEDVDRVRRNKDKYGDDLEEAELPSIKEFFIKK